MLLYPFLLTALLIGPVIRICFQLMPLPCSLFGFPAFLLLAARLVLVPWASFKHISTVNTLDLCHSHLQLNLEWLNFTAIINEVEKLDELYGLVKQGLLNQIN
jgi:hypothetical protein